MKRYTFTCVLSEAPDDIEDPKRFVRMALTYGDKHQDFALSCIGDIQAEDEEGDE
jgi:hypothetical protein